MYLSTVVGVNKRSISHALILVKLRTSQQIDSISNNFGIILETLKYHNNDRLYDYCYSYLNNVIMYFKYISKYVGKRTHVK